MTSHAPARRHAVSRPDGADERAAHEFAAGRRPLSPESPGHGGDLDTVQVPPVVDQVLGSTGVPLDGSTRASMQHHLGHDLADVRIHSGPDADRAADAVAAGAFTVGPHVVLGRDVPPIHSPIAAPVMAHELVHVVQHARDGGAPVLRRIPAEGLPLGVDLANEQQRALDRERAGVEGQPGMGWEELRRRGFGYVIDQARSLREATVQGLHAEADQRLHPLLLTPVHALIDLLAADLAVITDVLLFDVSLALGFVESAVETVVGALTLVVKLCEVAWHLVLAGIYDVQERLARLGLTESPDEALIAPLAEDVAALEQLWATLPQAVLAYLVDWRDRFLAAPHEEKAVMAGDLVGGLLFEIATWEVSAAKAGKLRLPAVPGLAAVEPELAAAVVGGGSMRVGAGALASPGVKVAAGGPVGAGGAAVLQAAGKGSNSGPSRGPLDRTPDEVAEAFRKELGEAVDEGARADLAEKALDRLEAVGVDVDLARLETEVVLSAVHDQERLGDAVHELQRLAREVSEAERAAEADRLLALGVKDPSGSLAVYVAAAKRWAEANDFGVAEVYGDFTTYVVHTAEGRPPIPVELKKGVDGVPNAVFMEQVIASGHLILDYALLDQQHGALPHVLQQMVVDRALKAEGFEGVVKYRERLGGLHGAAMQHGIVFGNATTDPVSAGSQIWLATFDAMAGEGFAPEDISPALLKALGLREGDL